MRFSSFTEGLSVQIMYIGICANETPTIQKIHDFINEKGYELRGNITKYI